MGKINMSFPATGCQKLIEIADELKVRPFYEKRMGQEVEADTLGDEFKGYVLRITGGNDKQGFPMKQGILTDDTIPRRLGPKRASKIRKLFNLTKEDDVCQYVIKRPLPLKDGKKQKFAAPKVQRLVTPVMLQRKRHRLALKRRRGEKNRLAAAEYAKILAQRQKEAKEAMNPRGQHPASKLVAVEIMVILHHFLWPLIIS